MTGFLPACGNKLEAAANFVTLRTLIVKPAAKFKIRPLGLKHWKEFEKLFGARGACGGCWCMWWRLTRAQYLKQRGEGNKIAMRNALGQGGHRDSSRGLG